MDRELIGSIWKMWKNKSSVLAITKLSNFKSLAIISFYGVHKTTIEMVIN